MRTRGKDSGRGTLDTGTRHADAMAISPDAFAVPGSPVGATRAPADSVAAVLPLSQTN